MATIKVKYRASTVDGGDGTIYYQIIHNRVPRQITTDYHIRPDEWDGKRSVVTTSGTGERQHEILSVRDRIRRDVERLRRIISKLDAGTPGYTSDAVVEMFRQSCAERSFCNCMEKAIARLKLLGKYGTAENYHSALNSFRKFLATRENSGDDVLLDAIISDLMEQYEAWQRGRGICLNTISFYTRIFRAVYNRAVEDEIIEDRNPFKRVYTGVDKTVKRALSLKMLRKIRKLDLSMDRTLDYARDMFFMSFYLRGMSFVDMCFLKKSDLNGGYIRYCRRKTNQRMTIAWTPEMQGIVDKYPGNRSDYLLPIITGRGVNERRAYKNMGYKINRALRKIGEMAGEPARLTLYRARHSWGSLARAKGVPVSVISEAMGHDNEKTTRIYLASLETSVVDKANRLVMSLL